MRNRYEIRGDVVEITLNKKNSLDYMVTVVSKSKLPKLLKFDVKWFAQRHSESGKFLVTAQAPKGWNMSAIQLHRFLTDCPYHMYVVHHNNDTLDNTDENLWVTPYNSHSVARPHETGPEGVYFDSTVEKWYMIARVNGWVQRVYRYYDTESDAQAAFRQLNDYWKKQYVSRQYSR